MAGETEEWRGNYERAQVWEERAIELAQKTDLPEFALPATWFLAKSLCCQGEYSSAARLLREDLELAERLGDRAHRTRLLNTLGWCYAEAGDHERAEDYNRRSVEIASEMLDLGLVSGAPELLGNAAVNLAVNQLAGGRISEAEDVVGPVQAGMQDDRDPWMRWRYGLHLRDVEARLALANGDAERALALAKDELERSKGLLGKKIHARARELYGRVLVVLERPDEAASELTEALRLGEAIGYPPVQWRSLAALAALDRRGGDANRAGEKLARARALLVTIERRMDDDRLIRSLRRVSEQLEFIEGERYHAHLGAGI